MGCAMAEVNVRGLHFNPLQQQLGTRNATRTLLEIRKAGSVSVRCSLSNDRWGYRDESMSRHLVFQQRLFFSSMGRSRSKATAPQSTYDPSTDSHPKSIFSFSIVDLLVFLVRIPALVFGFLKEEKKYIEKIEDLLEDAAEAVGDIAEVVESVAGAVERVAENIAEDAKETRELMDKVEATAKAMRTELDTAIDSLEEAPAKSKSSGDKDAVPDIKAVAEAATRAAGKLQGLKEAAGELEKASNAEQQQQQEAGTQSTMQEAQKPDLSRTGIAINRSAGLKYRAVSPSSLGGRSSRLIGAVLFAVVMVTATLWQPQMTSAGLSKFVSTLSFGA